MEVALDKGMRQNAINVKLQTKHFKVVYRFMYMLTTHFNRKIWLCVVLK